MLRLGWNAQPIDLRPLPGDLRKDAGEMKSLFFLLFKSEEFVRRDRSDKNIGRSKVLCAFSNFFQGFSHAVANFLLERAVIVAPHDRRVEIRRRVAIRIAQHRKNGEKNRF